MDKNELFLMSYQGFVNKVLNKEHFILLDVRTLEEYNEIHLKGSILLPVEEIESRIESQFKDKNITYVIYCRSGVRSYYALLIMKSLGYQFVYDLGGIIDMPDHPYKE